MSAAGTRNPSQCLVTRILNARSQERYGRAVEGQGLAFVEIRTPPPELPRDARGRVVVPPVELFGDARPLTAEVLSGEAKTTWGWPSQVYS